MCYNKYIWCTLHTHEPNTWCIPRNDDLRAPFDLLVEQNLDEMRGAYFMTATYANRYHMCANAQFGENIYVLNILHIFDSQNSLHKSGMHSYDACECAICIRILMMFVIYVRHEMCNLDVYVVVKFYITKAILCLISN